jgi:hypothetical protein
MHAGRRAGIIPPQSGGHIHDRIAHAEVVLAFQRLGEKIRQIIDGVHVWNGDLKILDTLANKEVTALDMFDLLVVLWVVRDVTRSRVVHTQLDWLAIPRHIHRSVGTSGLTTGNIRLATLERSGW